MEHSDDRAKLRWMPAPAASTSRHLTGGEESVNEAFDRFRRASDATTSNQLPIKDLIDEFPRQAEALAELLVEAGDSAIKAQFILTSPPTKSEPTKQLILQLENARPRLPDFKARLDEAQTALRQHMEVYSDEIPQANTVVRIFQAVEAMVARGKVTIDDIANISNQRQVRYYEDGARVLRFFDDKNEPTQLAKTIHKQPIDIKLKVAAKAFNESTVGTAWRVWAKKRT